MCVYVDVMVCLRVTLGFVVFVCECLRDIMCAYVCWVVFSAIVFVFVCLDIVVWRAKF